MNIPFLGRRLTGFISVGFLVSILTMLYSASFGNADNIQDAYYEPSEYWQYPPGYEQYSEPNYSLYSYGTVKCPEPSNKFVGTAWSGSTGLSLPNNLAFWDSTNHNANYNSANYGLTELAVTWNFNQSFQYQGDSKTGTFNTTNKPPWNATANYVEAIARIKINNIHNQINAGFFSVFWSYGVFPTGGMPWLQSSTYYSDIRSGQGVIGNGFYNSTEMAVYQGNPFQPYISYRFDITPMFATWNSTILRGLSSINIPSITVAWIQNQNLSSNDIDYLGIQWGYGSTMIDYTPYSDTQIHVDFEMNFNGLLWLLILFFPAIAMNQVLPVLGFSAGMTLMLIILGFTQAGFAPFAIMGLIVIGIMLYKGD